MKKFILTPSVIILLFVAVGIQKTKAQDWETFDKTYHGHIGKAKITLHLVDRFGTLQGSYYYDRFKDSVNYDPRYDKYTIWLEGSKRGDSIYLNETCWYCKEVDNPESFEGKLLSMNIIRGVWTKQGKNKNLNFQLTAERDTESVNQAPVDPENVRNYHGKDIWASGFFQQHFVQQGLSDALGDDLLLYIRFLQQPMARLGLFITPDSLLSSEFWIQHNGPSDQSIMKVDLNTKKFYIFWYGAPNADIKVYGDNIPPSVLEGFAASMNSQWGSSRHYFVKGKTIEIERK